MESPPRVSASIPPSLNTLGDLAAGIAHEIKTPTQYVGDNVRFLEEAFADLLSLLANYRACAERESPQLIAALRAADAECDIEYLLVEVPRAIQQSIDGLARISAIVLAIKELSHPHRHLMLSTDLNKLVRSAVTVCASEWRLFADLQCETPEIPTVECSPGPVAQVVINLVVNAAHAIAERAAAGGPSTGHITVRTAFEADGVEIRITDTGSGIPEAIKPRIFEHHFTTKPAGQGTGQGLHIARQIIESQHHGRIWFETVVDTGTCFAFWLPLHQQEKS
jgi:two-component system NtrC family sensor kinase